jgi:hypothetical protein
VARPEMTILPLVMEKGTPIINKEMHRKNILPVDNRGTVDMVSGLIPVIKNKSTYSINTASTPRKRGTSLIASNCSRE